MISSGARFVSRCGVSPGSRWKSSMGMARSPPGPRTRTTASSAARATPMSDGCVAMQAGLVPKTPHTRFCPAIAGQPLPGRRLLQGRATS